jgi:beta-glucanase (GH16 family)
MFSSRHASSPLLVLLVIVLLISLFPASLAQGQSTSLVFIPVADATVNRSVPDTNYGSRSTLSVDGDPIIRGYMRFDVRGLNGRPITGARLRLYVVDDSSSGIGVAQISSNSWSESTITYNTAPTLGSTINRTGAYGVNRWIEIDVTSAIKGEGLVSLALSTSNDTTTAFASRETGANAPQLVVVVGSTATATATNTVFLPMVTHTPTSTATRQPTPTPTKQPTATPVSGQVMPFGVGGSWVLKFSDDFNGTSLDLRKWEPNWLAGNNTAITKPINRYEESCYDPAQVSVANGSLKLSAVARSCKANNGITYKYASGLVNSSRSFTFNYGYMEARVWTDGSTSIKNWPAFWANGTGTWPTTGEIDVFEGLSGNPSWHYHYGTTSNHQSVGGYPKMDPKTGWHIYAAEWGPGYIYYYYDGVLVGKVTSNVVNSRMYIILNYGLSTEIAPPVQVPSHMLVDYVRVWQKAP